jgi:hypothetical protein
MTDRDRRLRLWRVIGFGLLAEAATILVIVVILTLHSRVFAAGQPQAVVDDFAQRVPMILGPVAGILFTFIAAVLATRPLQSRVRTHGLLVGVVSAMLTFPGMLAGAAAMRAVYGGAMLLKLAAGYGAGMLSERRTLR